MPRQRLRFGAHNGGSDVGRELENPFYSMRQIFRNGFRSAAGFGQMLVADPVFPQIRLQKQPILVIF
jgi:hypothetical protein